MSESSAGPSVQKELGGVASKRDMVEGSFDALEAEYGHHTTYLLFVIECRTWTRTALRISAQGQEGSKVLGPGELSTKSSYIAIRLLISLASS